LKRKIQEAPAAGNRGKKREKDARDGNRSGNENENPEAVRLGRKEHLENAQDELQSTKTTESAVKPVNSRRGRSSTGSVGAAGNAENTVEDRAEQGKRVRPSTGGVDRGSGTEKHIEEPVERKKKSRPVSLQTRQADVIERTSERQNAPKSQSIRPSTSQIERQHTAPVPGKPRRKSRSLYTEDELVSAVESSATDQVSSKKRSSERSERNHKADLEKSARRGRSSNTEAEVQAIFDEATRVCIVL
jgi:hypothetical protein